MSKEKILQNLLNMHQDEKITYLTCCANGCWDANCILKVRIKDGKIAAIEADDSVNKNIAREDAYIDDIEKGMIQMRPCVIGRSWKSEREFDPEDRITKPLKRVGGRGPGNGYFVEISWEEAIDTIAQKIVETREKFGDYSMTHTHLTFFEGAAFPIWPYFKGPVAAWSDHSTSGHSCGEVIHLGYSVAKNAFGHKGIGIARDWKSWMQSLVGFEAPDLFNSDLIIMWGWDPLVGWHGAVPYYLKMAKERGAKIICIDPRYTLSAEVLADQYIPIRPGTDTAMMLAVAYVILHEGLEDKEFCEKWVDLEGLAKWKNYLEGGEDGEAKTPEWAESICAVPAETIYALARTYAAAKACHLQAHYSVGKRHYGDYAGSCSELLQAITGNIAKPGGCESGSCLGTLGHIPPQFVPDAWAEFQKAPADFENPPSVIANNKLAEAIALRPKFENGEITEEEYRHAIGCPAGSPTPNIQLVFFGNNWLNNLQDSNKRYETAKMLYFTCGHAWHKSAPTTEYLDIVLPGAIFQFETTDPFHLNSPRFRGAPGGLNNHWFYSAKAVDAPGEVRSVEWFWTQIANKLGFGEKYNPLLKDVPWDKWDEEVEKLYAKAYEKVRNNPDAVAFYKANGVELKPWEEFLKDPIVRVPIDVPFHAFQNTMSNPPFVDPDTPIDPFPTPTGKIEPYANVLAVADSQDFFGGKVDPMPRWKPSYMYEMPRDGYFSNRTKDYPLSMVTPVSLYRDLSAHDRNKWLNDCYNHRIWLSPADAKARGIKDNDDVLVYNELAEAVMKAYVTNKIIPGTTAIHFGAWYQPNSVKTEKMPNGIDTRGSCNMFIEDVHLPHAVCAVLTAGLVNVKKFGGIN